MRVSSVLGANNGNFNMRNKSHSSAPVYFGSNKLDILTTIVSSFKKPPVLNQRVNALRQVVSKRLDFLSKTSMKLNFGEYELPINNPALAPYMGETYSYASFKKLYRQAGADGFFDFKVNEKTGFVKTSDIVPKNYEEEKMADLTWVTDTCRNMSLLKKDRPDLCTKALESISKFYKQQQGEFDDVIANPDIYKFNHGWNKGGVSHAFYPHTNQPNYDYPRTRLESIGHYLQRASEFIVGGLEQGKISGYKNADEISDNTIDAISSSVKYLSALKYPHARSCGAWEENTFHNSLTSDTAIINEGFRRVINMVFKKTDSPELLKVRERLLASKNGDVFKNKDALTDLLRQGEERLISNHSWEAPGERKLDAALSFVTHYENSRLVHENPNLTRSQNVMADIKENVKLLMSLEGKEDPRGLVGDYGIARYLDDTYKNLNYDLPSKKGLINENHEAQWFMVSDISKGYGVQLKKLLKVLKEESRKPNEQESDLIELLLAKQTEFNNRTYARGTGKNQFKANGQPCSPHKLPEAYQAISDDSNKIKFVPGTNTPLAWAQSSALEATKTFLQNLKAIEEMGLVKEFLLKIA